MPLKKSLRFFARKIVGYKKKFDKRKILYLRRSPLPLFPLELCAGPAATISPARYLRYVRYLRYYVRHFLRGRIILSLFNIRDLESISLIWCVNSAPFFRQEPACIISLVYIYIYREEKSQESLDSTNRTYIDGSSSNYETTHAISW